MDAAFKGYLEQSGRGCAMFDESLQLPQEIAEFPTKPDVVEV